MEPGVGGPRRPGLSGQMLGIAAVGLLCCVCTVSFAITHGVFSSPQTHTTHEAPPSDFASLVNSGLGFLAEKLVDPDGHSDELEHPAILLDPDVLDWEAGGEEVHEEHAAEADLLHLEEKEAGLHLDEAAPVQEETGQQAELDEWFESQSATAEDFNDPPALLGEAAVQALYTKVVPAAETEQKEEQSAAAGRKVRMGGGGAVISSGGSSYNFKKTGCKITKELLEYTLQRINNTKTVLAPYPHLYVTQIFEPTFYQNCIMKKLPPTDAYEPLPNNKDRHQIPFAGKFGYGPQGMDRFGRPKGKLAPRKAAKMDVQFWTEFGRAFAAAPLATMWLTKLMPTLQHRGVEKRLLDVDRNFWYTMSLGRDHRGYSIGPHTDTSDKWVTTLFYLPKDNKNPQLGTVIVKSKSGRTARGNTRGSLASSDFMIAKKAGFTRNSVLAFAACDASWHAVQKVPGTIRRDTIQGFVSGFTAGGKKQCGGPGSRKMGKAT